MQPVRAIAEPGTEGRAPMIFGITKAPIPFRCLLRAVDGHNVDNSLILEDWSATFSRPTTTQRGNISWTLHTRLLASFFRKKSRDACNIRSLVLKEPLFVDPEQQKSKSRSGSPLESLSAASEMSICVFISVIRSFAACQLEHRPALLAQLHPTVANLPRSVGDSTSQWPAV